MSDEVSEERKQQLINKYCKLIEWISEIDHDRALELDAVVARMVKHQVIAPRWKQYIDYWS